MFFLLPKMETIDVPVWATNRICDNPVSCGGYNTCHTLPNEPGRCGRGKVCRETIPTGDLCDTAEYCTCPSSGGGGDTPTGAGYCPAGYCNDRFRFGEDPTTPQATCDIRNGEACATHNGYYGSSDPGGGGGDGGGGGGGGQPAPTSVPSCVAQPFGKASVAPSTLRPFDQVTVKCNYGKRLDCLSVVGAGLKNCRYSRYEGTDNIFSCDAGPNAGFYDDAKCVTSTGTADNCCKSENKVGDMNILGTEVHYDQDIVLPFGTYTLAARVFSVISKGKGNTVSLICNSATCANNVNQNGEVASLSFPEATDFIVKSLPITLNGTGDDRHYLVRVSVDKASEAYFDFVSLKNAAQKELVQNGDFTTAGKSSVTTKQPVSWGEGDNKIGYYYGSVADEQITIGNGVAAAAIATGPTPTPGKPTAMSLTMKIKLHGVSKKPKTADPIPVLVKLAGQSFAVVSKSVIFTVDDVGVWTGKADFDNVPTGGGYRVYIKGPKHIQKKICDTAPSEEKAGTYHCSDGKIVLAAGDNVLNFSNIIQLAGDLPETGDKQSGIVDSYDTTFIRQNLGSTEVAKTKVGDLNLDGGIDTQDYSMVLQSLSIKYDEE